jgi:threonine/homoserine/homoserine lactone efflux protein
MEIRSVLPKSISASSVFYTGFIISFLGSLPPGTVNIITIEIAGTDGYYSALSFAAGCAIAELICVKACLLLMVKVVRLSFFTRTVQWLSFLVMATLSFTSFRTVFNETTINPIHLLNDNISSLFIAGLIMMIINPVQVPFWLGWTTILVERKIPLHQSAESLNYIMGIALGSLIASALFIGMGQLLSPLLIKKQSFFHFLFGCTFAAMAILQLWRIRTKKAGNKKREL